MARAIQRYIWLVDTVSRAGKITYADIKRKWVYSSVNDLGETDYPKRTFLAHLDQIKTLLGIDIVCDRRDGYSYSIQEENDKDLRQWLHSLVISTRLLENQDIRRRVRITDIGFNNEFLMPVLDAIEKRCQVDFACLMYPDDFAGTDLRPTCNVPDTAARFTAEDTLHGELYPRITRMNPLFLEYYSGWFVIGYVPERNRLEVISFSYIKSIGVRKDCHFSDYDFTWDHIQEEFRLEDNEPPVFDPYDDRGDFYHL